MLVDLDEVVFEELDLDLVCCSWVVGKESQKAKRRKVCVPDNRTAADFETAFLFFTAPRTTMIFTGFVDFDDFFTYFPISSH